MKKRAVDELRKALDESERECLTTSFSGWYVRVYDDGSMRISEPGLDAVSILIESEELPDPRPLQAIDAEGYKLAKCNTGQLAKKDESGYWLWVVRDTYVSATASWHAGWIPIGEKK